MLYYACATPRRHHAFNHLSFFQLLIDQWLMDWQISRSHWCCMKTVVVKKTLLVQCIHAWVVVFWKLWYRCVEQVGEAGYTFEFASSDPCIDERRAYRQAHEEHVQDMGKYITWHTQTCFRAKEDMAVIYFSRPNGQALVHYASQL